MILACEELFWLNIDIASRGFAGNVCSQIYVHRKFQIKRQPALMKLSLKSGSLSMELFNFQYEDLGFGGGGGLSIFGICILKITPS